MKWPSFRYRLRSLLVGITLISVALGWYMHLDRQRSAEAAAIEILNQSNDGGYYIASLYDDDPLFCGTGVGGTLHLHSQAPVWLAKAAELCGSNLFHRVDEIDFWEMSTAIRSLDSLHAFTYLKKLKLRKSPDSELAVGRLLKDRLGLSIEWIEIEQ
jgi:hypothetical protein